MSQFPISPGTMSWAERPSVLIHKGLQLSWWLGGKGRKTWNAPGTARSSRNVSLLWLMLGISLHISRGLVRWEFWDACIGGRDTSSHCHSWKAHLRDGALPRAVNLLALTILKANLIEHFKVTFFKTLCQKGKKKRKRRALIALESFRCFSSQNLREFDEVSFRTTSLHP